MQALTSDDVSELTRELARTSQQLVGGVDELHRAAKDLARQETQLLLKEGELAKMRTSVLAASGEIDAIRQALAELAAKRNGREVGIFSSSMGETS